MLKAWIKRNHLYIQKDYCDFGSFLIAATEQSRCDRFAKKHFKYAAGGRYMSDEDLGRARAEIRELY